MSTAFLTHAEILVSFIFVSFTRALGVIALVFGKLKIAAGFYTVIVLFESVYALPFPSVYIRFISLFRVLDFFPALGMLKLNCVVSYSFYSVLHLSCTITFCLMLLIVANSFVALLPSTATLVIFFMLTMVYPSVSTIAFRTFNCRSVDGISYLREDYTRRNATLIAMLRPSSSRLRRSCWYRWDSS